MMSKEKNHDWNISQLLKNKKGVLILLSLGSVFLCPEGPLEDESSRDIAP